MMINLRDANTALVTLNNGDEILFSYDTPVAGETEAFGHFRSSTKHSVTTSKKVGQYFRDKGIDTDTIRLVPQDAIEAFVDAI